MKKEIRLLTACGAGETASAAIKSAVEKYFSDADQDVIVDICKLSEVTKEKVADYDGYLTVGKVPFKSATPFIECSGILYRVPSLARPVLERVADLIKNISLTQK
ncbi:hypothetical protein [Lactobacillus sp.]|uniref:hypothetical protein n=1 Tax=Lactobacillus sp. TaxID=1591 RepID=UPI00198750BB|nr:hypothetical protein [Lactobacillus sp.]MBD5430670.1 hypothetical protein [Lactobacillus sp.]